MTESAAPRTKRSVTGITIDLDLCKSCGICIALCPSKVFDTDLQGRPIVARLEECTSCQFCERHCPDFAVELEWGERVFVKRSAVSAHQLASVAGDTPGDEQETS